MSVIVTVYFHPISTLRFPSAKKVISVWKDCMPSWAHVQGRFFWTKYSMAFSIRSQLVLENCAYGIASHSFKSFCTQPFLMSAGCRIAFKPIYYSWVTWDFIYKICTYYTNAKFKKLIAQHNAGNDAYLLIFLVYYFSRSFSFNVLSMLSHDRLK